MTNDLYNDTDRRVIDQRIGMGIGGIDTVIRLYHKPTGILIEMPRVTRNQFHDNRVAFEMLEYALADKEVIQRWSQEMVDLEADAHQYRLDEIQELKADIDRLIAKCFEQHERIEELQSDLDLVYEYDSNLVDALKRLKDNK